MTTVVFGPISHMTRLVRVVVQYGGYEGSRGGGGGGGGGWMRGEVSGVVDVDVIVHVHVPMT